MSQQLLPPYSTYRIDDKQLPFPQAQSKGNVLAFTPPGFSQPLWIKFPDSRLAVCDKCKKNFKTRETCRVRNRHSTPPWTACYICITVDESCLDANGKFIDEEMTVRMVQWQPYCVKNPLVDAKTTPVCAACKRTNRTRTFCRERNQHRLLPWNTVYVLLSTLQSVDPSTVVAKAEDTGQADDPENDPSKPEVNSSADTDKIGNEHETNGDDIHEVPDSRTFLAVVSSRATSIHWLELGNALDPGDAGPSALNGCHQVSGYLGKAARQTVDPTLNPPFYNSTMNNSAQQLQYALKQRQQLFFQQQLLGLPLYHNWPSPQSGVVTIGEAETRSLQRQQQQQGSLEQGNGGSYNVATAMQFMTTPFILPAPGMLAASTPRLQQLQPSPGSENMPVNSGQHGNYLGSSQGDEPISKRRRGE